MGKLKEILSKIKKKNEAETPATQEEINQLKLELEKVQLERKIKEEKTRGKGKSGFAKFKEFIGPQNETVTRQKRSKGKRRSSYDESKNLRSMVGTNDTSKYKGLKI